MEFTHTHGDWEIVPESPSSLIIQAPGKAYICEVVADNDQDLLTEKEWSNARLIAAAPEMLDMLIQDQFLINDLLMWIQQGDGFKMIVEALRARRKRGQQLNRKIAKSQQGGL